MSRAHDGGSSTPQAAPEDVDTAPVHRIGNGALRGGTILRGRYRLAELVGRGGMADVFRGVDELLDRPVAVKVFRPGTEGSADRQRFLAEVRTLAGLAHPNLVAIYDGGQDDSRPWCVMRYLDGGTLSSLGAPGVSAERVAAAGAQVADGLAYIHARGIVHRDVKPSNVLLDSDGDAHLSDFGVAQLVDATRMTATGTLMGTAAYLSPEQVRGEATTAAVDIYALALVLLEILTGEREFPGAPVESAVARLSRAPHIPRSLGRVWYHLLSSMTAADPEVRPDAATVASWLRTLAGRSDPTDAIATTGPTPVTPSRWQSDPDRAPDTVNLNLSTLRPNAYGGVFASPRISTSGPELPGRTAAHTWSVEQPPDARPLPQRAVHAVTRNPVRSALLAATAAVAVLAVWQFPAVTGRPVIMVPESSTSDLVDTPIDAVGDQGDSGGALVAPSQDGSVGGAPVTGGSNGGAVPPLPTTDPSAATAQNTSVTGPVTSTDSTGPSPTGTPTSSVTAVPIPSATTTTATGTPTTSTTTTATTTSEPPTTSTTPAGTNPPTSNPVASPVQTQTTA